MQFVLRIAAALTSVYAIIKCLLREQSVRVFDEMNAACGLYVLRAFQATEKRMYELVYVTKCHLSYKNMAKTYILCSRYKMTHAYIVSRVVKNRMHTRSEPPVAFYQPFSKLSFL